LSRLSLVGEARTTWRKKFEIPRFLDLDKDGRVWFGEWWMGKIGVLGRTAWFG
jgi:hypothetical protein